jgi:hypothetical protein
LVDDLPVGFAKLKLDSQSEFILPENTCQLQKIYFFRDFLSMKIGFELQNRLLDKAKVTGYDKIWPPVLKSNDSAINFYKMNGFKNIGNHSFHIGKEIFDFMAMSKILK